MREFDVGHRVQVLGVNDYDASTEPHQDRDDLFGIHFGKVVLIKPNGVILVELTGSVALHHNYLHCLVCGLWPFYPTEIEHID